MITVSLDHVRLCISVIPILMLAEGKALNNILLPSINFTNSPLYELLFFRTISSPRQVDTISNVENTFTNICYLTIQSP